MANRSRCCSPGCEAILSRGCIACQKHWYEVDAETRAKALKLLVHDREHYSARILLQDYFERMKGQPS